MFVQEIEGVCCLFILLLIRCVNHKTEEENFMMWEKIKIDKIHFALLK